MQPWNNNNDQYGGYPPQGPPQGFGGPIPMGSGFGAPPPMYGQPPMGSGFGAPPPMYGQPPMGSGFGGPPPFIGEGGQNAGGTHPPYSQQGNENEVEGRRRHNEYSFLNKIFLVSVDTNPITRSSNLNPNTDNSINPNTDNSINPNTDNSINPNTDNSINLRTIIISTSDPESLPVDQAETEKITNMNLTRPTNM
jgi:hypothetical protein